jgi:hypothetical protein
MRTEYWAEILKGTELLVDAVGRLRVDNIKCILNKVKVCRLIYMAQDRDQ